MTTPEAAQSTPAPRYTGVAIGLHWLMLVAIVSAFAMGLYIQGMHFSPAKLRMISYHKWAGVTIFALLLLRLVWRLTHRPPALPAAMPVWQKQLANATHHALYLLMFAIPLTGWLMSSAKGIPTVWFGLLQLPDLLEKNTALGDLLKQVHLLLNLALAGTVFAHAGAALKHHFIDRDDVLTRMLPALRVRR
jgi:cytochrome b561